ncbi:hypothetical protein APHACPA_1739 [Rickettsia amblyommatis str. Ac/Pa]|uniref:Uncharacterized protein n=1 Tax=Rickettsia amblyommatis str. Ac/Pa TaxID=1359164 RepID=A0A0F3N3W6_RICAM|nr:hypothetical protein APHACPA_1739 [Rickettsia amblyommatis str. Ac/Pa]
MLFFFENLVKITAKVINNAEKNYSRIQKGSNKTNLKASELGVY